MQHSEYRDISVDYSHSILRLVNSRLRRCIDFSMGMPRTHSFEIDDVPCCEPARAFDMCLTGFPLPDGTGKQCAYAVKDVIAERLSAPDGDGFRVTVQIEEAYRQLQLSIHYYLYPELPVLAVDFSLRSAVVPQHANAPRQTNEGYQHYNAGAPLLTVVDRLCMPAFALDKSVEFYLRTDYHNDQVLEHPCVKGEPIVGNVLLASDSAKHGFFFLQEAPPSNERRAHELFDFTREDDGTVSSLGSGIEPEDVMPGRLLQGNRCVTGMAVDGDAPRLLKQYLLVRRPVSNRIAGLITVNPWGCGHFPERLNLPFLTSEIVAAGNLHADVYQVDDGYEHGQLEDLIVLNRPVDRSFWKIREDLLPNGFSPLTGLAAEHQVALSLWFAPSSNVAYNNWRESADILLEFHRKYGFNSFKLDGVLFTSSVAEENFGKLLQAVYAESKGKVAVNLDVTNGTRGGLFKFAEYGSIFLENRYCCHEWPFCLYSPEQTLATIWQMANYYRIQNLQMEVPSPDDLLPKPYRDRGMRLPTEYSTEYWAMVTLFTSPLLWLSSSSLKPETASAIAKIMQLQRNYRENWRLATIAPIGKQPSGKSICGFLADNGWMLLFRELEAPQETRLELPAFSAAECLYAMDNTTVSPDGLVYMERPGTAALFKLSLMKER